jgi:hypothetical protein
MPSPFDRHRQLALMVRARPGYTAGDDLGALTDISSKARNILKVNTRYLINAERTYLFAAFTGAATAGPVAAVAVISIISHETKPPYQWNVSFPRERGEAGGDD